MSRAENQRFGMPGHHCFMYAELLGRYCFHVNVRWNTEGAEDSWFHFVAADIRGLLELLKFASDQKREIRVSLQTPFSSSAPSGISEITELLKGYDLSWNEIYSCRCADGQTYVLSSSSSNKVHRITTVWP
jgi:hypothetical protein